MPYETRSRTGKKPPPVPALDCCEATKVPAKTTRKKTTTEGKSTDKKGRGRPKTAAKSSKSSDSSSSNPGTLRRRPKDLPVLTEDEEDELFSEPVAPEDPMQNHRQHYGALANLLEAYTDNTEEKKLHSMYDSLAVRTRRAMERMERLKEKHKDDTQSILAKTPLGKKVGLKALKEEGSDDEDLFEDSGTDATSAASVASSVAGKSGGAVMKTPVRKLRPRKRKSVVVAKSPWRQTKVVKAKKKKSMKKKKAIRSGMDHDSSASTQASNHQDEAPPPPVLQVQPNIKKAQKRPVETTPQKTMFSVPSEFDFGQKVAEPSSKKRILAHPGYKFAKDPTVGDKTDKPKIIDTKGKKLPSLGSSSSNGEATKLEKRAKGSKELNQAAAHASEEKKSMESKTKEKPESKDVPPKKIKKLTKAEMAGGGDKSNDIQTKVSQPVVQQATAPEAAFSKLAGEEPDLFETSESLKLAGPSKASTVPSISSKSSSTSSHSSQDVKKTSIQRQASVERHLKISSQKTPAVYDATFVVSEDEPMQTPPPHKATPGSSGVKPGLYDATFVVPKKTAVERKPSTDSHPSKAGNSTPTNIGNSTFVVPPTAVAPKEPVDRSSKEKIIVTPIGKGSERSAQTTTATKKVPTGALNVKPTQLVQQPASSVYVEKSSHPKLSGKEKLIANQARKGSAASSSTSSSGDSQASVKTASSVTSGKSHAYPAGKLLLPRQSPGMAKDYGLNKLPVADPEVERKRQEEKQRKAEEKKNQFIQQKREMQKKINEEWKAKLEKKKEEDARQADEKNKIQSGKAEDAKGAGYVKNIINFFKTPGVVQVGMKVATLPFKNVIQAGAMSAASSCPDVSKKYGTVPGSSAMKQKDVYGSVGQLVAGSSKGGAGVKLPSKPSPKKPATAAKPAVVIHPPPSAPVLKAPVVAPAKAPILQNNGLFERSLDDCDGDESFATADTTMDERNENVNNYEITVYEDLDDNMRHRENKRIPAWAADEDQLNMALFLQQPNLINLIRKPIFPQKNIGFKIFPGVPH